MSVINTNVLALTSQNNLTKSQNALGTAIERLSSGLRINSAKDDAAGQAIANRFTANIKGLTQATRNANDGISIAQTTEGSLNEINSNLQRVRELTVQAANGSNTDSDLQSIQNEINERLQEIDRVSRETQFNDKYVLGKDGQALTIQVGAHDDQKITINLETINVDKLGLNNFSVAERDLVTAYTPEADSKITIGGEEYTFKAAANVTKGASSKELSTTLPEVDSSGSIAAGRTNSIFSDTDGNIYIKSVDAADAKDVKFFKADLSVTAGTGDTSGTAPTLSVKVGAEVSNITDQPALTDPTSSPLSALDTALQQVDDLRSHLGAIQNRFESTIANLNNTVNNLSAARSRIEDADYAVEVSNMTRAQILQQAGTSVLAQANQVPQGVLSLLR